MVRRNKLLPQLDILLLGILLRDTLVDDLLPLLALGLALVLLSVWTCDGLRNFLSPLGFGRAWLARGATRVGLSWRETYGEVHHARLGCLLDVLALGDFGVGVELEKREYDVSAGIG